MNTKYIFLLAFPFVFCTSLFAKDITGIVNDAGGEAIAGASVTVQGTTKATITGIDGRFFLNGIAENALLTVNYISYQTQTVSTEGKTEISITLAEDFKMLDEIVVTGYNVQKRRDVSGAVSKVAAKELTALPVSSAQMALQGRVAGMSVTGQTGEPGAAISVRIRGVGSISSSNEPLYIVDGIPVESGLENLSPNDIENITVLKDASSAAIYGSRANNGVVLVTTKKGEEGASKVQYNTQIGFQQHGRLTPMVNTAQYIDIYNEATRNDNLVTPTQRPLIEGNYLLDNFADVNHLEEIFRTAPLQSHELTLSGGSKKTQYLLSTSYFNQDGIILNTGYERLNIRSNINSEIKEWLQASANISVSTSGKQRVSSSGDGYSGEGGSVVRYAFFRNPAIPTYDANGGYVDKPSEYFGASIYDTFFGDGYNPVALANITDMTYKTKSLLFSTNILIKLPRNFSLKAVAGVDYATTTSRFFYETWGTLNRINATNSLDAAKAEMQNTTVNATLNHNFTIAGNHSFNWFAGAETIVESGNTIGGSESDFADLLYLGKGKIQKNPYQSEYEARLLSFFGTLNYNFAQKYYLSLLIREDGSSRFSRGNRWGTFYSAAASWNIESERFMQDFDKINKLKLRAGYGAIGNQNIGLYADKSVYDTNGYYIFGGVPFKAYAMSRLGNENLKWETSNQFNAGLDLEMWRNTFGATIDCYYKITGNMLVEASYPPSAGNVSLPWVNNGSVLNSGVDIELFYRKNYKNGGFNIALNGGFLHNEVLELDAPIAGGGTGYTSITRAVAGQPVGAFYLYEQEGIFQNEMEILTSAKQGASGSVKPGDIKYRDQQKEGEEGYGVIDANDRIYAGSAIPKFTTGLTLSGNYRNFDLSLFFQGAFGQKIYSVLNSDIEGFGRGFPVTKRYYDQHWTGEGTSGFYPRAAWTAGQNRMASTHFLEDGSYFRLKNLQIGYSLPEMQKFKIDRLRIYLAATNLLTLTKYYGLDPEMTVNTNDRAAGDRANGIDWGTYPVAQTFTLGLNITF
jgi:TonB-linked SusC/RagA family outer membrane protein